MAQTRIKWLMLALAALTIMGSYYTYDSIAPVAGLLRDPFRSTFSIQYFQDVKGMNLAEAGTANSYVFAAAIFATPVFGLIADRIGKRASLLTIAAALMPLTFFILATTDYGLWVTTILMGISFSVIPAVIWPSTAMLVEKHRIGTAFGLINMIQSLGLAASNYAAGQLNDAYRAGPDNPGAMARC